MNDPSPTYTSAEEQTLAENLYRVTAAIHRGELFEREARKELLCKIHRELFADVRSHAGRNRKFDFGSERLTFGPNRSVDRKEVPTKLDEVFDKVRASIDSFDRNKSDPAYEEAAFHLAVWSHAEVVRIHPFEDGNGRSSRALMNWVLVRLGLRPVTVEVPKQEYRDTLNHFFIHDELRPLLDLILRLYPL